MKDFLVSCGLRSLVRVLCYDDDVLEELVKERFCVFDFVFFSACVLLFVSEIMFSTIRCSWFSACVQHDFSPVIVPWTQVVISIEDVVNIVSWHVDPTCNCLYLLNQKEWSNRGMDLPVHVLWGAGGS